MAQLGDRIVRVVLTAPHVSGRALAEAFHLTVGSDSCVVSRPSVAAIRAAFLEMYKDMVSASIREVIASALGGGAQVAATGERAAATGARVAATGALAGGRFVAVHITHVQDEADLRLLSVNPGGPPGAPRRGRSSKAAGIEILIEPLFLLSKSEFNSESWNGKPQAPSPATGNRCQHCFATLPQVQFNVVQVSTSGRVWELPLELQALSDKTAQTLATCFLGLLRSWFQELVPEECAPNAKLWFIHCLIGDGISTNEASAKVLLAARAPFWQVGSLTLRYFLLLGKCGTHQAALSAKAGVDGASGSYSSWGGKEHEGVTANAVRLFKYPGCWT